MYWVNLITYLLVNKNFTKTRTTRVHQLSRAFKVNSETNTKPLKIQSMLKDVEKKNTPQSGKNTCKLYVKEEFFIQLANRNCIKKKQIIFLSFDTGIYLRWQSEKKIKNMIYTSLGYWVLKFAFRFNIILFAFIRITYY